MNGRRPPINQLPNCEDVSEFNSGNVGKVLLHSDGRLSKISEDGDGMIDAHTHDWGAASRVHPWVNGPLFDLVDSFNLTLCTQLNDSWRK